MADLQVELRNNVHDVNVTDSGYTVNNNVNVRTDDTDDQVTLNEAGNVTDVHNKRPADRSDVTSQQRCSSPLNLSMSPVQSHTVRLLSTTAIKCKLEEVFNSLEASAFTVQEKTKNLCQFYVTLTTEDKACFLRVLATDYAVDAITLLHVANHTVAIMDRSSVNQSLRSQERLRHALIPRYQQLFTKISRLEHGVKFLVGLRADVITAVKTAGILQDNPHLQVLNATLHNLLFTWLSVGSLRLERITWESPCDMLQKVSELEAVRPIRNWADLKERVGPNRRCFVFTHACMPREPVIIIHAALTQHIAKNIQSIVGSSQPSRRPTDSDCHSQDMCDDVGKVTTTVFYSITSTQKGLQGIDLGNYLIKHVITELLSEFPSMHQFCSLSPIPGFKDWLLNELTQYIHLRELGEDVEQALLLQSEVSDIATLFGSNSVFETLRRMILNNTWLDQSLVTAAVRCPLTRLCARYLYTEKKRGYALNPVANFHLRNGAVLWRLNWLADTSARGMNASCGLMVNYRYYLDQMDDNSKAYVERQCIPVSQEILDLATMPMSCSNEDDIAMPITRR